MNLQKIFPAYPMNLKSLAKSKTKFGTRRLYVDVPWQAYYFLEMIMNKAEGRKLNAKEVKEEWHKFLRENKDSLTFHDKPFVSVSLRPTWSPEKSYLRLDVKWDLFLEYLEEKAIRFSSEIDENGENVMNVYREIWTNLFQITNKIVPIPSTYFPFQQEMFRRLLRRTGDYSYIENLLHQFEVIMDQVDKAMRNKFPSIQFCTMNLTMEIKHLRALIDVVNIPAAYLLLRNILENFIKFFIYFDVGKSIDPNVGPNIVLCSMLFYEYETTGRPDMRKVRRYSLKGFKEEATKKFLKIVSEIPHDKLLVLPEIINKLREKQMPTLGVKTEVVREFCETYKLSEIKLKELYSACSSIIHNQPPLPFFSPLEVKVFKNFLEKCLQSFRIMAEKLINEKIELEKINVASLQREDKECLHVAHLLEIKYRAEIKEIIKEALAAPEVEGLNWIWVKPLTLTSLFHLVSPSFKHLRDFSFIEEDMEDVISKLQPLTFNGSIQYEVHETLSSLQEMLLPKLEKYSTFSSLDSPEKKRKTIFYLLLLCLPETVEEMIAR